MTPPNNIKTICESCDGVDRTLPHKKNNGEICYGDLIIFVPITAYTELEKKLEVAIRFYQKYINKLDDGTQFCHDEIQELNKELEALEKLT